MNSISTTGLLAELRQQDLLREAVLGRLLRGSADSAHGRGRVAEIRRRLVNRFVPWIIRPASPTAGPHPQPEHLRRAPGRA